MVDGKGFFNPENPSADIPGFSEGVMSCACQSFRRLVNDCESSWGEGVREKDMVSSFKDAMRGHVSDLDLKTKNELLQSIFENPKIGIVFGTAVRDELGEIVDFEFIFRTHGFETLESQAQRVGRLFEMLPDSRRHLEELRLVVDTGITSCREYFFPTIAGHSIFLVSTSKFEDGIVQTWEDRSAVKKIVEKTNQLVEKTNQLVEVNQALSDFYINLIHEFRTSLSLVIGPVKDVLGSNSGKSLNIDDCWRLELVHRNALRLGKLVNSALDFSSVQAGVRDPVFQPTDIGAYTRMLAENFRSLIESSGLKFIVNCESKGLAYVNRDMWEKIVLNLVSNAYKYTLQGEIEVSLRETKRHIRLRVRDTGVGISSQDLSRIFEKFVKIKGASRTGEGCGIGLYLVNELVRIHGGSIKVKSKVKEGTMFIVTLANGKAHLPVKSVYEHNEQTMLGALSDGYVSEASNWVQVKPVDIKGQLEIGGSHGANAQPRPVGRKPVILYADDNLDMRQYITRVFAEKYTVMTVTSGQEVWSLISEGLVPDLVMMDVLMPELDGMELLKRLKDSELTFNVPVILLSSCASEEDMVNGMKMGADDYIQKPFSACTLRARVDAILRTVAIQRRRK